MKYRVLIADDHAIMREGVRALLQSDGSVEVVAVVDNGRDAVRLAVALKPDLAVMELTRLFSGNAISRMTGLRSPNWCFARRTIRATSGILAK